MARRHPSPAPQLSGVGAPVGSDVEGQLRQAVLDHVTAEHRRVFPPTVLVGSPSRHVARLLLDDPDRDRLLDHALRVDALEAMVHRVRRHRLDAAPLAWLTRCGPLEVQDTDLLWASAADSAARELGLALPLVLVTRRGWLDPRTGETRTWRRLRPARP